jgi:predicted PhzF superfamily epimerase YddE/YHI9
MSPPDRSSDQKLSGVSERGVISAVVYDLRSGIPHTVRKGRIASQTGSSQTIHRSSHVRNRVRDGEKTCTYGPSKIKQMRIPLFHVDAFTDKQFRGNPAAVCFLDSWLDEDCLRKVAAENNLSETAFLVGHDDAYELRWFTRTCDVRLCGHATLASAHVLLNILQPHRESVCFQTRYSGTLTVQRDSEYLRMDFPALVPRSCALNPALVEALDDQSPREVLEVNHKYLCVFDTPDQVRNLRPNFALLEKLHPFAVAITSAGADIDFVSRYFAPTYGVPEDPVTGSAHCALTPYWAKRLGKSRLHARQLSERGGELWCEMAGDRVSLRGKAVLTLQGALTI